MYSIFLPGEQGLGLVALKRGTPVSGVLGGKTEVVSTLKEATEKALGISA